MLSDELFLASICGELERAGGLDAEEFVFLVAAPGIVGNVGVGLVANGVGHGECDIGFVIESFGKAGDGEAGDDFSDEGDAAAPTVCGAVTDVEAEIDLFKVAMEGDGDATDAGIEEHEADEADESFAVPLVEFGFFGDAVFEEVW